MLYRETFHRVRGCPFSLTINRGSPQIRFSVIEVPLGFICSMGATRQRISRRISSTSSWRRVVGKGSGATLGSCSIGRRKGISSAFSIPSSGTRRTRRTRLPSKTMFDTARASIQIGGHSTKSPHESESPLTLSAALPLKLICLYFHQAKSPQAVTRPFRMLAQEGVRVVQEAFDQGEIARVAAIPAPIGSRNSSGIAPFCSMVR